MIAAARDLCEGRGVSPSRSACLRSAASPARDRLGGRCRVLVRLVLLIGLVGLACSDRDDVEGIPTPSSTPGPAATATPASTPDAFVGSARCAACHPQAAAAWQGSHHDLAMQPATPEAVLGAFDGRVVEEDGRRWRFVREGDRFRVELQEGEAAPTRLEVAYVFGVEPLQQLLVARPGGRLQALPIAWDTRPVEAGGQRYLDLVPDVSTPPGDPLHWDGSGASWNVQCAACHSTALVEGYDADEDRFETRMAAIDVGCEACHGAGSRHADAPGDVPMPVALARFEPGAWLRTSDARIATRLAPPTPDREIDVCAPCHARRSALVAQPAIGAALLDGYRPTLIEPGLYFDDGQIREEVYVWGSFLQSRMYAAGVRCSDCHDPHALTLRREGNALCTGCHAPAAYDGPGHHGHVVGSRGADCVDCHMPERVYMQIDARRDHAFLVPSPQRSRALGAPDVCRGCHAERDADWLSDRIAAWRAAGGRPEGPRAHWSDALVAGPDAGRWRAIAFARDATALVRASAQLRLAQAGDAAPDFDSLARVADTGDDLERLAAIEQARTLDDALRIELLAPRLEDARRAIRIAAAEALLDVPPTAMQPAARAAFARALAEHRAALEATSARPASQVGLGLLAERSGDLAAARAAYHRALTIEEHFVPALVNLADLDRAAGDEAAALDGLRRAVEAAPHEATPRYGLGLALHRAGRIDEARGELERAARLAPEVPRFALAAALALDAAGRGDEAIARLDQAIARSPRDADLHRARVSLLRAAGELDRARSAAHAFREARPDDPTARALEEALAGGGVPGAVPEPAPGAPPGPAPSGPPSPAPSD